MYLLSQILMTTSPPYIKMLPNYNIFPNNGNCEKQCSIELRYKHLYGCNELLEYMRQKGIVSEVSSRKSVDCDKKNNCCFVFENCTLKVQDTRFNNETLCNKLLNEITDSHSHIIK